MVARLADERKETEAERVRAASERLDELRREQAKGSYALRSLAHRLVLHPDSTEPLITPDGVDSGLMFRGRRIVATSGDGTERAVVAVQGIDSLGGIYTEFEIIAQGGIRSANGGISATGDIYSDGRLYGDNLSITGNSIWSWPRDGAIRWQGPPYDGALAVCNRAGTEGRGIFVTNTAPWGSSWRAIKRERRPAVELFGKTAGEVVDDLEISAHRYDPDKAPAGYDCDEQRYGPMLDELPDALRVIRNDPDEPDELVHTSYDTIKLLSLALDALQETRAEVAALRARVDELEAAQAA